MRNKLLLLTLFLSLFAKSESSLVFESDKAFTNVAISKDNRIFVSCPTVYKGQEIFGSLYEYVKGELQLFPNLIWNSNEDNNSSKTFVCVTDIYIDKNNTLWILDCANPRGEGIVESGVKLHKVNLMTNQIERSYTFAERSGMFSKAANSNVIMPKSFLNKLRVDPRRQVAYVSDSELSAILVFDLKLKTVSRALPNVPSTKGKKETYKINGEMVKSQHHVNAIALSPDYNWLYYSPQNGDFIYKIPTYRLRNKNLNSSQMNKFVVQISKIPSTLSMAFSPNWNLYFGGYKNNSLNVLFRSDKIYDLEANSQYQWISDVKSDKEGKIYFVASNQNEHFGSRPTYKLFKLESDISTSSPFGDEWELSNEYFKSQNLDNGSVVILGDRVYALVQTAEMFGDVRVKNRSSMSNRTDGILLEIKKIAKTYPEKIILCAGINDLETGMKPEDVIGNFKQIVKTIKEITPGTEVVIQAVLPVNGEVTDKINAQYINKTDRIIQLNALLQVFCSEHSCKYIDTFNSFKETTSNYLNLKYSNDGLNLNADGYLKLKSVVEPYIQ